MKLTVPVTGFEEVIVAVKVNGVPDATFVEETDSAVVVGTGPPPPPPTICALPPPQPSAANTTSVSASPVAMRRGFCAVKSIKARKVRTKAQLKAAHPRGADSVNRTAPSFFALVIALVVPEGADTAIVRVDSAAVLFERATELGANMQVVPRRLKGVQVRLTLLLRLLDGVSVSVEVPDCPAVIVTGLGLSDREKSGVMTVKPLLWAEALRNCCLHCN